MRPVLVEWNDSYGIGQNWREIEEVSREARERKAQPCRSFGVIIFRTDEILVIAPHLACDLESEPGSVCGEMTIPMAAVTKIQPLACDGDPMPLPVSEEGDQEMNENELHGDTSSSLKERHRFQALSHYGRTTIFFGSTERDRDPAELVILDPPLEFKDDWMAFRVARHLNVAAFGKDWSLLDETLSGAVASGGSES